MVTTARPPAPPTGKPPWPRRRLWTVGEYHRAAELGLFRPDEKLELISGEVMRKVSPQGSRHMTTIWRVAHALEHVMGSAGIVLPQSPLVIGDVSEPEPDVLVATGSAADYDHRLPRAADALLVVEVADATLAYDRSKKAAIYAAGGIPEYWIFSLRRREIEVHRHPDPEGHASYRTRTVYGIRDTISPLGAPDSAVRVADLLPTPSAA